MRKTVLFCFVTSVLVLLAACSKVQPPPDLETAAVRVSTRFSGLGAVASFMNTAGCTTTYADIIAAETLVKEVKNPKTLYDYAEISFSKYNECTDTGFYIYGSGDNTSFSINRRLTTATLTATLEACRYNYPDDRSVCGPAKLTMSWTGHGKLTRSRSNSQVQTPTYTVKEMHMGTSREATATGSFSFRGKTYALKPLNSSSEALLISGKGSIVTITK